MPANAALPRLRAIEPDGAGFAGRTAVGPRIRVHGNDPQERTCAHCPSDRGAARSPRRRCRDRDAGRSPDRPGAPGRRRRRGRRCSCDTPGARAMAAQRGPAARRARGRRRDGRGRRRSRAVAVIAAVHAVVVAAVPVEAAAVRVNGAEHGHAGERAEHGMEASGQGRHGGRQARAHLQACIVRATGARRMMRRWSERPGCSGISCRGVSSVGSRAAGSAPRAPLGPGTRSRVVHRCSARLCGHVRIHHRSAPAALGSRLHRV